MLVGDARVSTRDQDLAFQLDALTAAGGAARAAAAPGRARRQARRGDTLVVWTLDRLARSLQQLIATVEALATTTSGRRLVFHLFAAPAEFERGIIRERTMAGPNRCSDRKRRRRSVGQYRMFLPDTSRRHSVPSTRRSTISLLRERHPFGRHHSREFARVRRGSPGRRRRSSCGA